ncbi:MAG: Na(+)-translocating NADH-quinone reductase subunit C [Woeseiaceae bacterium]|nr:Na(+)-translocating NADH-quinone reductase subunit C [Woeseiaceae bacterium]
MPENRDSIRNTFMVAIGVALVCSVLVSAAAVILKPLQEQNETRYRQQIVLRVAGLYEPGADTAAQFAAIDARIVELATGEYVDGMDPESFDMLAAASDLTTSVTIPPVEDVASLKRRAKYAPVYLVREGDALEQIILPVYGPGLWSTMYGYLSVAPDGRTIRGLRFYEHAETPGLGDQVEKDAWLAQWEGKLLYGAAGEVWIEVVRGQAPAGDAGRYQVDGMSGATLTGNGVTNLLRYWAGPHGYGPYLETFSAGVAANE